MISRRTVLQGLAAMPFAGVAGAGFATQIPTGPFTLPALAYPFAALEPHIDAETMQIHHDRHHQTYVTNLNVALAKVKVPPAGTENLANAIELVKMLDKFPEDLRPALRNNAGGHVNHTMFWAQMKPGPAGAPTGPIADAINGTFGSYEKFQAAFEDAGLKRFGSGWVWLARTKAGKLEIVSTPNQDNPYMDGGVPILGNDVWEHAYYLKYRNKRADYLKAWWNVVNWDAVNAQLKAAK
jgi:Fe-Mn family superoxide dismutase